MEKIMFFGFNPLNYIVSTHSVDFKSIIPLLENQDFCIVSAYDKNDKIIKLNNDEWIKKNHSIYINELVEIDEELKIYHIYILLDNNGFISFDVGQLKFKFSDNFCITKNKSVELLKQYGIYSAEECWNIVCQHSVSMPVYFLIGLNENEFNITYPKMINEAYRVDNFHNEDYSRERYIIRDENEKIKEIGFILNNQKIGECNFYNSQGLKYLTENWIHNSKGKAILYSSIKFNTLNNEI